VQAVALVHSPHPSEQAVQVLVPERKYPALQVVQVVSEAGTSQPVMTVKQSPMTFFPVAVVLLPDAQAVQAVPTVVRAVA
jgi:hypothetical protein